MGVTIKPLRNLSSLVAGGLLRRRARILEFGAQNVFCADHGGEFAQFIRDMRAFNGVEDSLDLPRTEAIAAGGLMADLMTECGFDYLAIDIFASKKTILFDLNCDGVPGDLLSSFDLVTNFGTTEHVLNQFNCFATAHDFARPGGLIYHDLPMGGYFFHGYFSYTPLFFFHLAEANEYEIVYRHYWKAPGEAGAVPASAELTGHGWPEASMQDWGIEFIFRKTSAAPFRLPVEIGTSNGPVEQAFLERKTPEMKLLG